jgi:hydrogenase maturation protease
MPEIKETRPETWIIGLGNPQRRDDGVGSYIIQRLREKVGKRNAEVFLTAFCELDPNIIMDLIRAELVVFVDATPIPLNKGLYWSEVEGWIETLPYLTHHYSPQFILGLLHKIYRHYPEAWLVSIEGEDFEQGEGLTSKVLERSEKAVNEITAFISGKRIDREGLSVNYKRDRSEQWATEKISSL